MARIRTPRNKRRNKPGGEPRPAAAAPLGGTREEALQRLKVGLLGLGLMTLAIGVATIVTNRAKQTDAAAVPEAVQSDPASAGASNDPLADAGVVPDLPEKASESPVPDGPVLPEAGTTAPATPRP